MIELHLIGIGTGNPDHLTLQAIKALNRADLILLPLKGADKADLAETRRAIIAEVVTNPAVCVAAFDMPRRDADSADYKAGVEAWHEAIAVAWQRQIEAHIGTSGRVALLVWGDPSLYDSTLRIAGRLARDRPVRIEVVPGITSIQALTAAHGIPLNAIGASVMVTTGRLITESGWPAAVDTLVVMLDGECAFRHLPAEDVAIWWGAYLGLPQAMTLAGPLADVGPRIIAARAQARADHGWIMDIYLLRRRPGAGSAT
ncbi:MAG: precorrin-6A synthase (deacetylating) [Hyphomicrobiaceae bacterium]|nr:precorrin-6A synthase (deacetylating) [Hyphomicrobiaceae bacterium]